MEFYLPQNNKTGSFNGHVRVYLVSHRPRKCWLFKIDVAYTFLHSWSQLQCLNTECRTVIYTSFQRWIHIVRVGVDIAERRKGGKILSEVYKFHTGVKSETVAFCCIFKDLYNCEQWAMSASPGSRASDELGWAVKEAWSPRQVARCECLCRVQQKVVMWPVVAYVACVSCACSSAVRSRSAHFLTTCRPSCAGRSFSMRSVSSRTTSPSTTRVMRSPPTARRERLCSRWISSSTAPRMTSNDASSASWRGPLTRCPSVSVTKPSLLRRLAAVLHLGTTYVMRQTL